MFEPTSGRVEAEERCVALLRFWKDRDEKLRPSAWSMVPPLGRAERGELMAVHVARQGFPRPPQGLTVFSRERVDEYL
jgi:hypothetical protein